MTGLDLQSARSFLFVPADRPERFNKALDSAADAVILDLEDAVAPKDKATARSSLAEWFQTAAPGSVSLRINDVAHPEHQLDLRLAAHPAVAGVMLPKVDGAASCQAVSTAIGKAILALVETAKGIASVTEIAASTGVYRLVLGTIDLSLDLDIDPATRQGNAVLDHARAALCIASRAAGLPAPIDGVHTDFKDEPGLKNAAAHARGFGFSGMLAIHPRQADVINQAFSPTPAELQWAVRVVEAASDPRQRGAFSLDGRMIDAPVIEKAKRTLLRSRR